VWTTYRGEFWHRNSLLPQPYEPPALIYLIGIFGLVAAGWLMLPRRVVASQANSETFKPRDLTTALLFLCVFAILCWMLGRGTWQLSSHGTVHSALGWGFTSVGVAVLGWSALRFIRAGAPDEVGSLAEQRLLTGWLAAATLLGLAVVCLFAHEGLPPPHALGLLVFVLFYATYYPSRRVLRKRRQRTPLPLQFSLRQLLAVVTICCLVLSLWSARFYVGSFVPLRGAVLWFPALCYVVLAFRAARRPAQASSVVDREPPGVPRAVRTSRVVVALTGLLVLGAVCCLGVLAIGILFGFGLSGPLGLLVGLDVVLGMVVFLVGVGAQMALLAAHRLGRGFCWVFAYAAGWAAGVVVYSVAGCFIEYPELRPFFEAKLTLTAAGIVGGIVLSRWVQGFGETSARRAGLAAAGTIALGMVLVCLRFGFSELSAHHAGNALWRATWAIFFAAVCAGLLGAIWGALGSRRPRSPT
jgi:hypothetical protein